MEVESRLCLGESNVAKKSFKNYLVLRETEKLFSILQSRIKKYIGSVKNQNYYKMLKRKRNLH